MGFRPLPILSLFVGLKKTVLERIFENQALLNDTI